MRVSGLEDTRLTEEEKAVISGVEFRDGFKLDTAGWKSFKVGDMFEMLRGKEPAPNQVLLGNINMINETQLNNGVSKQAYSEYTFLPLAITVSVNYASTVFVQTEKFCASVNILILKGKEIEKYPKSAYFIASILRRNNAKYNYGYKISKDKLYNTELFLPATVEGKPDYEYMTTYIRALEKLTIQKLYDDETLRLNKMRDIVNRDRQRASG